MPRDYANKKSTSSNFPRYTKSRLSGWFIVLTFVLIIAFTAGLLFISSHHDFTAFKSQGSLSQTNHPTKSSDLTHVAVKPRFEFYTILPQMKVSVPVKEENPVVKVSIPVKEESHAVSVVNNLTPIKLPTPTKTQTQIQPQTQSQTPTSEEKKTAGGSGGFILQVASFSNYQDADKVKAELVLLGFHVVIKPAQTAKGIVNRVWIGPYRSIADAQLVQKQLTKHDYKSFVTKINV